MQVTVLSCDRCARIEKPEKAVDWRPVEIRIAEPAGDGKPSTLANGTSTFRRWEHLCGECLGAFRAAVVAFGEGGKR